MTMNAKLWCQQPTGGWFGVVSGTDRIDRSSRPISRKVEPTEKLSAIDRYFVESIEIFKSRVDRFTDDWSTIFR